MSHHRLPIHRDEMSFDERTEQLMRDVRRRMDEDLQRFGFGRSKLSGSLFGGGGGSDLFSRDHDFFQLRPLSSSRDSGSPRREEWGSRESLDDDTTKRLYRGTGAAGGACGGAQSNGSAGRVFTMNFDVKDYRPEDISVTVEDETLIVEAKRKIENDGGSSTKQFSRKIRVPPDVDPEKLTSTLTSDGILTVEAPAPPEYGAAGRQITEGASTGPGEMDKADSIPLDTPVFSQGAEAGGRRTMQLRLEVGKPYTPDDIVVKLEGRTLIVEAVHEEKTKGKTSKTSMQRDFDLSEDIDLSTVQALLRPNGQLHISALV